MRLASLLTLALPLALLTACKDKGGSGDDTSPGDTSGDADGDGYTVGEGDCDDGDDSVFPGAD